jgi:hypothetical protein
LIAEKLQNDPGLGTVTQFSYGDGETPQLKSAKKGKNEFKKGAPFEHAGRQCTITTVNTRSRFAIAKFPAAALTTTLMSADLSALDLCCEGLILTAAFLPKCSRLTSLDISRNQLTQSHVFMMGSTVAHRMDETGMLKLTEALELAR